MASSQTISTLSEFLLQAQTQYEVFDLGRGIRPLAKQTFFEWENQQAPCAFPRQDHAWFCIVFWNKNLNQEHYMWFIKLPLDEKGLIMSASLNQFLEIIVKALGKELEHTSDSQAQLPENPFVFKPSQQQLADCNAHIRRALSLDIRPQSDAHAYLYAPNSVKNEQAWAQLSVQDIADFVIYPKASSEDINDMQSLIAANLPSYAAPVLHCLFASLESVEINDTLCQALINFHKSTDDSNLAALCLRAMSFKATYQGQQYILSLIEQNDKCDLETCVVIIGRYWQLLSDEKRLHKFMHNVALLDPNHNLFKSLYADLVKVPYTRNTCLDFIRSTERTEEVAKAIGSLFS